MYITSVCLTLSRRQILDSSKLKEITDDNYFILDENGRKFYKKGGKQHDEQYLLFPQCFQKTSTAEM